MLPRLIMVLLSGMLLSGGTPPAPQPGPQVTSFLSVIDDSDQPYGLYVPKNYSAKKKYPLVISLHGAFSNHRVNLRRVFGLGNKPGESDPEVTRVFPPFPEVDYIVASPFARGTAGYRGIAETDVWQVLADVKKRFNIDEDRIYLTGLSMGGRGTLELGLSRPDMWAAIAPVCPPEPWFGDAYAVNATNLPVHFFHGDKDDAVPVAVSRKWAQQLKTLGVNVQYTEYPGVKHNSWDNAYADAAIFRWFGQYKRNRFPERVRFVSQSYRTPGAYWVRFTKLTPGTNASIDARFTAPNEITVDSKDLGGFELLLAGHSQYNAKKALKVTWNGEARTVEPGQPLQFGDVAKPGLEGPIGAVTLGRHIYVYGTQGNPSREELAARRAQAYEAAQWYGGNQRLAYFPRVMSDREVKEPDVTGSNLILFGSPETNSLVAKYSEAAPMRLKPGMEKEYGLVFLVQGEGKDQLVVINSGLPFTTGAGSALPAPHLILMMLPDYLLFKETARTPVSQGRYTGASPQLPADVVEVR